MKKTKNPGYWVLNIVSVFLAVLFLGPIIWALAVSFQHEGKQIKSVLDWFTPPYTLGNYPKIIFNSQVPTWLINSLSTVFLLFPYTFTVLLFLFKQ